MMGAIEDVNRKPDLEKTMPNPADMPATHGVDPQVDPPWEVEIADVDIHLGGLDRAADRLMTAIEDEPDKDIRCGNLASQLRRIADTLDGR